MKTSALLLVRARRSNPRGVSLLSRPRVCRDPPLDRESAIPSGDAPASIPPPASTIHSARPPRPPSATLPRSFLAPAVEVSEVRKRFEAELKKHEDEKKKHEVRTTNLEVYKNRWSRLAKPICITFTLWVCVLVLAVVKKATVELVVLLVLATILPLGFLVRACCFGQQPQPEPPEDPESAYCLSGVGS